jgi:hypothetical protein
VVRIILSPLSNNASFDHVNRPPRSGGNRFYSKNDANNMVTLVGEFLLQQHMSMVWKEISGDTTHKYEECSDYVQQHRLTLSFEVVTAVLGDHGDIPKQPYLICK